MRFVINAVVASLVLAGSLVACSDQGTALNPEPIVSSPAPDPSYSPDFGDWDDPSSPRVRYDCAANGDFGVTGDRHHEVLARNIVLGDTPAEAARAWIRRADLPATSDDLGAPLIGRDRDAALPKADHAMIVHFGPDEFGELLRDRWLADRLTAGSDTDLLGAPPRLAVPRRFACIV